MSQATDSPAECGSRRSELPKWGEWSVAETAELEGGLTVAERRRSYGRADTHSG